jgi:type II secretory ATPase GspE/PulE/Tfp pilus assembly ATPase PilB-like protein
MSNANSIEDLLKDSSKLKGGKSTTAKKDAKKKGSSTSTLSKKMTEIKIKEEEAKAQALAQQNGFPYIDLVGMAISPETLTLISREDAKENKILSFLYVGRDVRVGVVDPTARKIKELVSQLEEKSRVKVEVYQISQHSFDVANKLYEKVPVYKKPPKGVQIKQEDLDKYSDIGNDFNKLNETINKIKDSNMTEMVALIIAASLQAGSSDIHIEAEEKDVKVRLRVDGILHDASKFDKDVWSRLISRMKQLSGLKINIANKPQDGRFTIHTEKEDIDVRVSVLPTAYGESVVMRLLKSSAASLEFDQLGLTGLSMKRLEEQIGKPNGMIITTGPTGSGKTTTLYAILNKLNEEGVKVITLEDPIEYRLEGINQSQIGKGKSGEKEYTFADGLRSILRQDPDVVMVGEIRDLETADVAVNAANTGHLVISTIHTNNAAGAVPRFLNIGVKGVILAPAVNAIMGQRLVRRICENCKVEYNPTEEELTKIKTELEKIPDDHPDKPDLSNMKFHMGKGCEKCNDRKYKGRIGIYEILVLNEAMRKNIIDGNPSTDDIQKLAIENQMITMVQDGFIKALEGKTSIEEVLRVAQ